MSSFFFLFNIEMLHVRERRALKLFICFTADKCKRSAKVTPLYSFSLFFLKTLTTFFFLLLLNIFQRRSFILSIWQNVGHDDTVYV